MKSQRDSSFPADGHKVIQIKWTISKRPTESERTLTIRINHNRSTTLERSVINYWGGVKPVLRALNLALGSAVVHIHIQVFRFAWRTSTCQWIKTVNKYIKIHHWDETRRVLNSITWRWSNRSQTVERQRQWARPKTEHQARANLIESFTPEPSCVQLKNWRDRLTEFHSNIKNFVTLN